MLRIVKALIFLAAVHLVALTLTRTNPLFTASSTSVRVSDFAYYAQVSYWWSQHPGANIYDLHFQQSAMSELLGEQSPFAMAFNLTPIGVGTFSLLTTMARGNLHRAYLIWTDLALALFGWGVMLQISRLNKKRERSFALILVLAALFSACSIATLALGQTSLLGIGLFLIANAHLRKTKAATFSDDLLLALLLIPFGIKPQYFALAGGMTLLYGRWRAGLASALCTLTAIVWVGNLMSSDWIQSYRSTLEMYRSLPTSGAYAWGFAPQYMNLFKEAAKEILGQKKALEVSWVFFAIGMFAPLVAGALIQLRAKSTHPTRYTLVLMNSMIATYLLFSPHSGQYEDMWLLVPALLTLPHLPHWRGFFGTTCLLWAALLTICLNLFALGIPIPYGWIVKSLLLGSTLLLSVIATDATEQRMRSTR